MKTNSDPSQFERVAIVHEWLTIPGGSEKVVMAMLDLFPQAELFTTIYDPEPWPEVITSRTVHASFLDRIPGATRLYPRLLPLMNAAFESFDLSSFDLVISSSHACAKNVLTDPGTVHACYCHTPMRYAWEPGLLEGEIGALGRLAARALMGRLRRQDAIGSLRPDAFAANSTHVAARIAKYYRRSSVVLPPPVEVDRFLPLSRRQDDYYLVLGRVVPYKRVEMAVAACALLGRPLKVVGEGRAMEQARAAAWTSDEIEFLGFVDDDAVAELLSGARALLFPGEEDFGVVPVEAQAAGVPVIGYGHGGLLDSIEHGRTGILYGEQTTEALVGAIEDFEREDFDEAALRRNAMRFGPDRFAEGFRRFVSDAASPILERPPLR